MPFDVTLPDGLKLAADRFGDGPPVMLVHGLGFDRSRWTAQTEALVDAGFSVVTFDLRGFGGSEMPSRQYTVADLAGDLDAVRSAAGLDSFHLVGHSLGGMVCLRYAVDTEDRLRSLTLASTSCHNGQRASSLAHIAGKLSEVGFEAAMADPNLRALLEGIARAVEEHTPDLLGPLRKIAAVPDPARGLAWRSLAGFSTRSDLEKLACPVLVMHGDKDFLIPFAAGERLAEGVPGARWVPLAGAGHALPTRRAEEFNAALLDFLGSVRNG